MNVRAKENRSHSHSFRRDIDQLNLSIIFVFQLLLTGFHDGKTTFAVVFSWILSFQII